MMEKNAKIYVAGHRGMVGSAIVRELRRQHYTNLITRTHRELDLTRQDAVEAFFAEESSTGLPPAETSAISLSIIPSSMVILSFRSRITRCAVLGPMPGALAICLVSPDTIA